MTALTQSMSPEEFREKTVQTLDRVHKTGEAEVITLDGEEHAVLLSPEMYDEMIVEIDLATIRTSMKQIDEGKFMDLDTCFERIHAKLLAMRAAQTKGAAE
jgi:PHD/YefM family antitoxin component YafN of YafNO toxin-antitoxin module